MHSRILTLVKCGVSNFCPCLIILRFLKFGRMSTMKLVLVAITSLLLASEAQPTVLKLERPNALPGGGVVELPVNGTGKYSTCSTGKFSYSFLV